MSHPPGGWTFILRLWQEGRTDEPESEIRGEVKTVPDGQRHYFRGFDGLAPTVMRCLEEARAVERGERVKDSGPN